MGGSKKYVFQKASREFRCIVDAFVDTPSFKRIRKRNADLIGTATTASPTSEQYSLFRDYLDRRHAEGGMADMSVLDCGFN